MTVDEAIIEPDLAICDPHHHLWDLPGEGGSPFLAHLPFRRYLLPDLLGDVGSGHNVVRTVFVDARAFYRADGPPELAPAGETEFVTGAAAMSASGRYGPARLCAGIVGRADMMAPADTIDRLLREHCRIGGDRFKGIRQAASVDPTGSIPPSPAGTPEHLYLRPDFRQGFARLAAFDLSFDAWCYFPQLPELLDLARAFPDQPIMLDHVGTPIGIGAYAGKQDEVFAEWRSSIDALAACPNVWVKLGGLGMFMLGFDTGDREAATSAALAVAWRPYIETCIAAFGVDRCLFESNFPVDAFSCSYRVLWNAFKRIASGCSDDEKVKLFHDNAVRFYRIEGGRA
jgi:predicted TIM-barrel fold metal-dependent hydrolase